MNNQELFDLLETCGQEHVLRHVEQLNGLSRERFVDHLESLDLQLVFELHRKCSASATAQAECVHDIQPAQIITLPETSDEKLFERKAKSTGEALLRDGKVAVLVVAGGQGSRLGFDGPKGTFRISPVCRKSLFQLFSEQVLALSRRYSVSIPLLFMTSEDNHEQTVQFFESNTYFGLSPDTVRFFRQDVLPAITPSGKLVLRDDTALFTNPNGHGGSLKAMHDSGILNALLEQGFTDLYYCQVDNPLAKIADPVFLGYHILTGSQVSTKLVRRRSIEEKVGVYVSHNGKEAIIEYSDLSPEYMSALDDEGAIKYWAGNTAIHVFSMPYIKKLNSRGFALPYHCAKKLADIVDLNG
ncbi:MAG TPA: UTP--glucose-1-phosphate uridylyltransferase, partial [Syntrophorhabdaceae bacterium]|nr:UTP--glucose-1-phosphate uridylyltransferase [Syntrophorhabdaceae bacterium]